MLGKYSYYTRYNFDRIKRTMGEDTHRLHKRLAKEAIKLSSLTSRKVFLLQCRKHNVYPKHIINNVKCIHQCIELNTPYNKKLDSLVKSIKRRILNIEIRITFWQIKESTSTFDQLFDCIKNINSFESRGFADDMLVKRNRLHNEKTMKLNMKIQALKSQQLAQIISNKSMQFVHNATRREIPNDVLLITGLGPKFSVPYEPQQAPAFKLITDFENAFKSCEIVTDVDNARSKVSQLISSHINRISTSQARFFTSKMTALRSFFKNNHDLIILKADKGSKTVIMYKDEYFQRRMRCYQMNVHIRLSVIQQQRYRIAVIYWFGNYKLMASLTS